MSTLDALDPGTAALLVIDMQNAFCHPDGTLGVSGVDVEPAQRATKPLKQLIERFQQAGLPVVWTLQQHFERDARRARKQLASHTAKRKRVSALAGTWDAQLIDELALLASDPALVVTKHRFGAFHETRLDLVLQMLGVQTLFVTGVTANACVETSMREAYLRDYDVVAVTDCIAAVRPEWEPTAHAVWAQYLGVLADSSEVHRWLDASLRPRALGVHHLLLETRDLAAAERFYTDVVGMTIRKRETFRDGRPLVLTHQGLGLTEGGTAEGGTIEHLAFRARNVDGIAERAQAANAPIVRGPGPGPYGHTVYLRDPDGNEIELFDDAHDPVERPTGQIED